MPQIVDLLGVRGNKFKLFFAGALAVILIAVFSLTLSNTGYVVKVDNQQIAVIDKEIVYTEALEAAKVLKAEETGLTLKDITNTVIVEKVEKLKEKPITKEDLTKILASKLEWAVEATAININGESKVYVATPEQGEEVIKKLKEEFTVDTEEKELLALDFAEEVTLTTVEATLEQLTDPNRAVSLILNGTDKVETYTVKAGDTLWDIAYDNGMTVNELKDANPQLKKDLLSIGQELRLVKTEPMVNVIATVEYTKEESIPYETKYISDSNLWRGQTSVKESGKTGKQRVTYKIVEKNGIEVEKEVLEKEILEEPKTKVVYQGTKVMVASRGGGGNGQLAWPLRGRITSRYGTRSSGFHTGLDIDGVTGDLVFAAESGTVISAGWSGSYGYCVDVDHGDGLLTRYAHLSKIDVKIAQTLKRGDLIGKVGSTGRSTGSHLHFEVRINGSHKNPMNYLD